MLINLFTSFNAAIAAETHSSNTVLQIRIKEVQKIVLKISGKINRCSLNRTYQTLTIKEAHMALGTWLKQRNTKNFHAVEGKLSTLESICLILIHLFYFVNRSTSIIHCLALKNRVTYFKIENIVKIETIISAINFIMVN